ncbi:MAG: DUF1501 domain-containing protein [Puniceicoccaceae bacterium]|nr:MAG: DUF1501 domain-containing protein [Puniceicoccaceae bacterium]
MNAPPVLPSTRREFLRHGLRGAGLLAFSRHLPWFLAASTLRGAPRPEKDRSVLVLVQLAGGNDGLNTLIPFDNDHYHRLRPTLALRSSEVLPLADGLGLHPALAPLQPLLDAGHLGLVQNVGYPNPNRSHFRAMEIWETAAESDHALSTGWLGRYFDNTCSGGPHDERAPRGIHFGAELPPSLQASRPQATFGVTPAIGRRGLRGPERRLAKNLLEAHPAAPANLGFLSHTMMDALVTEERVGRILSRYRPDADYPANRFAQALRGVAALILADLPTRVYFVSLGGFDTHSNQAATHARLLSTFAAGMHAFQHDLRRQKAGDRVLTMTFSEFGRRAAENHSAGTDHGTAAPLFVMGESLRGGLHGHPPDLDLPPGADPVHSTDFRCVYATVLERWLGCPATPVLGGAFTPLDFL